MIPTEENIREVAEARIKAIRAKARELEDYESSDERLIGIVVRTALHFTTLHHPPATAQAAVAWAITDMRSIETEEPAT